MPHLQALIFHSWLHWNLSLHRKCYLSLNYLLLQVLRFEEELKSPSEIKIPSAQRISPKELEMAVSLIKQHSQAFNISKYHDEYKKELMKIIRSKASGKKTTPAKKLQVAYTAKDDLFDQLKASLSKPSKKKAS